MNKKRNYPLFMVDRSKAKSNPYDFITCLDNRVGFVAKVIPFYNKEIYMQYIADMGNVEGLEYKSISMNIKDGGVVLSIVEFLYEFPFSNENKKRIKTLLKKSLKKYIHMEVVRTPYEDLSIDNQILQQEATLENARRNYDRLLKQLNGDEKHANYTIDLCIATIETLKKVRDQ